MKFVRFVNEESSAQKVYGEVKAETVEILKGDPLTAWEPTGKQIPLAAIKTFLPPIDPPDVIAIGANYLDHCKESDVAAPGLPLVFLKTTSSVIAHNCPIVLPRQYPAEVDYEAELAVVIGRPAKNVSKAEALDYVLGYTCAHDVSARDVQLRVDSQWARGKSFDTFCPLGPFLVTDFDPRDVRVKFRLNGTEMQNQSTADMIFDLPTIIEHLSAGMTLLPGSVILTGTPSGVGMALTPPRFLRAGDVAEVEVEGLGVLTNPVIAPE